MERKKIEEQERVLDLDGESAIVSASAGSGKTTVMIEKVLKYLMQGVKVKNILALTFTNQAAAQMKQRLLSKLGELVEKTGRVEFASEIDSVLEADISTFHSFYEKIVKKYFYIVGIQPEFEILSNEKLLSLKDEAFLEAAQKLKKESFEKYLELCDVLGKKRSDRAIKERIFKIDNFLSSQYQPEVWLEKVSRSLYENKDETLSTFFGEIKNNVSYFKNKLNLLLEKANIFDEKELCKHINLCNLKIDELLNCKNENLLEFVSGEFSLPKLLKSQVPETQTFQDVKEAKEELGDYIKKIKAFDFGTYDNIVSSFESCKENITSLVNLYCDYKNLLDEKKRELGAFDFSDLETFCAKILENDEICNEIKNGYEKIFVDEFQDINPMQYAILKKISKNNNVLFVGDAKQSIYAFRQSDVEIFVDICKEFETAKEKQSLPLNCNFRTNKEILDFDNDVFKVLMTEKSCGINYEKNAMFKGESDNSCEGSSVKIVKVLKEEKEKEEAPSEVFKVLNSKRNFKNYSLESKAILKEVNNVINERIVLDGEEKKVNFGDIAILVKNRSNLLVDLVSLFLESNVPFIVNDEFDLLSSKEVCLVISILKLCLNRNDDFALAAVMASHFGMFSFDELAKIKLFSNKEFFFEKVLEYSKENSNEISVKIQKFNSLLDRLNFEIQTNGASAALENLFYETKFFEFVLSLKGGKEREERLKQFLKYTQQSGFEFNLFGLVSYLTSISNLKTASLKKCDDNAVLITTIHASKGLEFPVVILGETGKDLTKTKPETDDLKIDKNLGFAIDNYNKAERKIYDSIFKQILFSRVKKKEIAENLRLLYVALTRAKNKLIITGEISKEIEPITKLTNLEFIKPTYLNYILGALAECKNVKAEICEVFEVKNEKREVEAQNIEILKKAKEKIDFVYANESATKLALKTSVSEVAFGEEVKPYESENSLPNKFYVSEHLSEISTPEEGTIVHEILEKVDFESGTLSNDVEVLSKKQTKIPGTDLSKTVLKNISLLREVLPKNGKVFKEKQFMIYASPKEIFGEGEEEKILIQGKLDLIFVGEKNILIDYKYTSITNEEKLVSKYKKQLLTYAFAAQKALGKDIDEIYLLSLRNFKIIKIK